MSDRPPNEQTAVSVKKLNSIEEMHLVVELQEQIWGYGSQGTDYPYPARALLALASSGGLVSMAFVGDQPAGFALAWLGRLPGTRELYLHGQLLGVVQKYRGQGLGVQLKGHQKDYALNQGIGRIGWTYDPLRTTNAYFNLHKLGAVTRHYFSDYYGKMKSALSLGQTSDRLWADWHIDSERVDRRLRAKAPDKLSKEWEFAISTLVRDRDAFGFKTPVGLELDHTCRHVLVEIPTDFDQLLVLDKSLAEAWRGMIRRALLHYLSSGYVADDFLFVSDDSARAAYYCLTRIDAEDPSKDRQD
ncbi:MAG TPA: GNAT family N-acetyltransferase [Acidobacteriota bacterium]|nr:GNAT family N-acetyltransferase [Acidobacteriota bacterium]